MERRSGNTLYYFSFSCVMVFRSVLRWLLDVTCKSKKCCYNRMNEKCLTISTSTFCYIMTVTSHLYSYEGGGGGRGVGGKVTNTFTNKAPHVEQKRPTKRI